MAESRRVELTDEQYRMLRDGTSKRSCVSKVIADLVMKAAAELAEIETAYWESVARLAGVEDDMKEKVTIDWVNRCLVIEDRTPTQLS